MRLHDNGVRAMRKPTRALLPSIKESVQPYLNHRPRILQKQDGKMPVPYVHWRRVSKGIPQMALDLALRRQVQLLEELGRHGDARRGAEPVEGLCAVRVGFDGVGALFVCHCVI